MKRSYTFMYLVDWGNGFLGGYSKEFEQTFNTPSKSVFDDLKMMGVTDVKIITPLELDKLRGYHNPSLQEYLGV